MSKRFLVTGALGCVGSWVARLLVREGVPVVIMDPGERVHRLDLLLDAEERAAIDIVRGDITDLDEVEAALDKHAITNVIHLAALQIPFCRANPPLGAAVNVVGTVNLFEAVKRRADRMAPLVYAGSVAMFDADDVDGGTGRLATDAQAHPKNHYGVYKQANEGNARIYWLDHGLPSVGLRPMTVYGPGRDQGMTSAPTVAMLAAAVGLTYHSPFGGRTLYNFAEDVARSFIIASRTQVEGAIVVNLPGVSAHMSEVVEAIAGVVPESAGMISYEERSLPFPDQVEPDGASPLGDLPVRTLGEGVRATIELFQERHAQGRLEPEQHGFA